MEKKGKIIGQVERNPLYCWMDSPGLLIHLTEWTTRIRQLEQLRVLSRFFFSYTKTSPPQPPPHLSPPPPSISLSPPPLLWSLPPVAMKCTAFSTNPSGSPRPVSILPVPLLERASRRTHAQKRLSRSPRGGQRLTLAQAR